jgi:hypothetical protein
VNLRDEDGQALVLALAFLIFFGLVIGALLSFAAASVLSTERLREQRSTVYAADGATDAAIQIGLATSGIGPAAGGPVGGFGDPRCQALNPSSLATSTILLTTTATTSDATTANAVCTWSQDPLQPNRTVTFTTFAGSATGPVLQVIVLYHDDKIPVTVTVLSWTYCGHSTSC